MSETKQAELTIDELALETGMTARNIRAHQSRGLLPPPEVRARTGYYNSEHVSRIKLIQDMQAQGYNLKAIERLLVLGDDRSKTALEFERALLQPFGDEEPEIYGTEMLIAAFGGAISETELKKAEKAKLIRRFDDERWEVPSPTMLKAARELVALGVPFNHALAVGESIRKSTKSIAREFTRLFMQDVIEPLRSDGAMDQDAINQAAGALERLRPLASDAVTATFNLVMTEAAERQLEKEMRRT